eukprot:389422-Pyramimonas_sp.AAC.1
MATSLRDSSPSRAESRFQRRTGSRGQIATLRRAQAQGQGHAPPDVLKVGTCLSRLCWLRPNYSDPSTR